MITIPYMAICILFISNASIVGNSRIHIYMIPLVTVTMDVSSNSSLPNVSSSFLYTFCVLLYFSFT